VVAAVVIMTYNRPDYLDRALKSVLKYHKAVADRFPLFVSQVSIKYPLSFQTA
jgi:GT2 family glycosyltransferase